MFSSRNDDKITFYLKPTETRQMIKWARFVAVMRLISSAVSCVSLIAIPVGVMGIVAAIKLFGCCGDLESYMKTGNINFSESAGDNFCQHFTKLFRYFILNIILIAVVIVAIIVLAIVFFEEIMIWWEEFWAEIGPILPEGTPEVDFLISRMRNLFHGA